MRDAVAAGATVLFASHELDRAIDVAHRTVVLAGGTSQDTADRRDEDPLAAPVPDGEVPVA